MSLRARRRQVTGNQKGEIRAKLLEPWIHKEHGVVGAACIDISIPMNHVAKFEVFHIDNTLKGWLLQFSIDLVEK